MFCDEPPSVNNTIITINHKTLVSSPSDITDRMVNQSHVRYSCAVGFWSVADELNADCTCDAQNGLCIHEPIWKTSTGNLQNNLLTCQCMYKHI